MVGLRGNIQLKETIMSENNQTPIDDEAPVQMTELDMLKQQARVMGLEFSNNIGIETLRKKINEALADAESEPEIEPEVAAPVERKKTLREEIFEREMKLVRVRITNMDPMKAKRPGDYFTIANKYLGTVRKFIPYGEPTDDGFHIPHCLYQMLKDRKFSQVQIKKNPDTGHESVYTRMVREFNIEVMDPLTPAEIKKLATAQMAAGSLD